MLTTLRIKNLALVTDLTLDLQPGLNVITGETGAGKSILIGALSLVLGERADRHLIRAGAEACTVEAAFDIRHLQAPLPSLLEEHGLEPCEDHLLLLKRTLAASGSNRQFINGSPTSLQVMARIGQWLVDIHGPHDHQSLLHAARQLEILDAFGDLANPRAAFAALLHQRQSLLAQLEELSLDDDSLAQQLDLLKFQAQEIQAARLDPGEAESLDQEYTRASNAARLLELGQSALHWLDDADPSLLHTAGLLGRTLHDLHRLDPSAAPLVELHQQAMAALQELPRAIQHHLDGLDLDPARLQELEDRIHLIQNLKRKYGPSIEAILQFGREASEKLQSLESRDAELARIKNEIEQLDAQLNRHGQALTGQRRRIIPKLAKAVSRELQQLGFAQSHFDVALESIPDLQTQHATPSASGFDTVAFQFAPNPGEPPRPLRAIASSGEMARVMLALKTVLAAEDAIPVLVFDEVDANIGGETASVVGEKMHRIAQRRQVFCVTHLPQVAAWAQAHYHVRKITRDGRTSSEIDSLNNNSRVTELARMLGGQSDAAQKLARTLLKSPSASHD